MRRVQRTSKMTDKRDALTLALQFEAQSQKAIARVWTTAQGQSLIQHIRAITSGGTLTVETIEDAIVRWLAEAKNSDHKGAKTLRNYQSIVAYFREYLGDRNIRPISELTADVIIDFRNQQKASGKSATTVNKSLGVVKQILDSALIRSSIVDHPFNVAGQKLFFPRNKKAAQKRKAFTFDQFRRLISATEADRRFEDGIDLGAEWQTFLLLTGYTGGRQQEPAQLCWESVDFGRGTIKLDTTKTDDEHILPLHPALEKHLRAIRTTGSTGRILPKIAAESVQSLSRTFREVILPRIGIIQPYDTKLTNPEKGSGRIIAQYSIHSLRHSLSTWLNELGVSDATRMMIVGHENTEVSLGYTHVDLKAAREGLSKVPDIFSAHRAKRNPGDGLAPPERK